MRILSILLLVILTGCLVEPNLQTGDSCWKYGVNETNTGPQTTTPISDIPIIKVDYETLGIKCNFEIPKISWSNRGVIERGCYNSDDDTIYLHRLYGGQYDIYEAQCHALQGEYANLCSGSYGIGDSQDDCRWNVTRKQNIRWDN